MEKFWARDFQAVDDRANCHVQGKWRWGQGRVRASWFIDNGLHAPDLAVFQHHLDSARMRRTARQDPRHHTFGQCAGPLILFLDDLNAHANFDFTAFGNSQGFNPLVVHRECRESIPCETLLLARRAVHIECP